MAYFGGIFFAIWGVGVVRIIFRLYREAAFAAVQPVLSGAMDWWPTEWKVLGSWESSSKNCRFQLSGYEISQVIDWLFAPAGTFQKRSGDPNPKYFSKSTAVQMGRVLQYRWEAYCRVSLPSKLRSQESTVIQTGAYCRTNWRCTAVLFRHIVGVGVSETLPNFALAHF